MTDIKQQQSETIVSSTTYACHVSASVGHSHDPNLTHRPSMEDEMAVHECDDFPGLFVAVYDGHGGRSASQYLRQLFHRIFLDELLDEELAISPQNTAAIGKSSTSTSTTTTTTTSTTTTSTTSTTTTTAAVPSASTSKRTTFVDDEDILSACSTPPYDGSDEHDEHDDDDEEEEEEEEEEEDEEENCETVDCILKGTKHSIIDITSTASLSPSSSISRDDMSSSTLDSHLSSRSKIKKARLEQRINVKPTSSFIHTKVINNKTNTLIVPRPIVLRHFRNTEDLDVKKAFERAYRKMDAVLKFRNCARLGATAVTCFIRRLTNGKRKLTIANCGDSRAILCRSGRSLNLTNAHRPSDPLERKRIEQAGGFISCGRINGILNVSRAFGDHWMKSIIICTPDIIDIDILNGLDEFLILACDGLWDFVDDESVIKIAQQAFHSGLPPHQVSNLLVQEAIKRNSTDNISIMVVHFDMDEE